MLNHAFKWKTILPKSYVSSTWGTRGGRKVGLGCEAERIRTERKRHKSPGDGSNFFGSFSLHSLLVEANCWIARTSKKSIAENNKYELVYKCQYSIKDYRSKISTSMSFVCCISVIDKLFTMLVDRKFHPWRRHLFNRYISDVDTWHGEKDNVKFMSTCESFLNQPVISCLKLRLFGLKYTNRFSGASHWLCSWGSSSLQR